MYKVTNLGTHRRQFYDQKKGRRITLNPRESAFTVNAIEGTNLMKVEKVEKEVILKKDIKIESKKEVDKK